MAEDKLNVIRIKRKRGDEPINNLLVEVPVNKKSYVDAFQALSTEDKEPSSPSQSQAPKLFCLVGTVSSHDSPTRLRDKIKEAQQKRKLLLSTTKSPEVRVQESKESHLKLQKEARAKEIKLFRSSTKGNEGFSDLFHLVDLVKDDSQSSTKQKSTNNNNNNNTTTSKTAAKDDTLLCNYMPMVREYLNTKPQKKKYQGLESDDEEEELKEQGAEGNDDEFVYDVYYTDATIDLQATEATRVRIESYDEDLDPENEYDEDTDSDDEENRITDIYPSDDEDPDFEAEYGTDDDSEEGYDEDDDENDSDEENYW